MAAKLEHAQNIVVGGSVLALAGGVLHQLGLYGLPVMADVTGITHPPQTPPDSLWWIVGGVLVLVFTIAAVGAIGLVVLMLVTGAHAIGEAVITSLREVADE